MNQVQCCKSGIFDVAIHNQVGVGAYSVTRDQNCNSFSDNGGNQLYLGQFWIFNQVESKRSPIRTVRWKWTIVDFSLPVKILKIQNFWQPKVEMNGSSLKVMDHLWLPMRSQVTVAHWLNCLDFEASLQDLVIWRFDAEKKLRNVFKMTMPLESQ